MKLGKLLMLLLFPVVVYGQRPVNGPVITKDSLSRKDRAYGLLDHWRFKQADSATFASIAYNDSGWKELHALVRIDSQRLKKPDDKHIGWYRLHFYADSTVTDVPLAVNMFGYGAYEIYIDGQKIKSYGAIGADGHYVYYKPDIQPFVLVISRPGAHVLAVRAVNYFSNSIASDDNFHFMGFSMFVTPMDRVGVFRNPAIANTSSLTTLFFSIFIVLAVVHLLLFLYNPSIVSNLYFCLFCFFLSVFTASIYVEIVTTNPVKDMVFSDWIQPISVAGIFFSLSGINNELFSRRKLRFRVITVLCVMAIAAGLLSDTSGEYLFWLVGIMVIAEALILPIAGIFRRVKGAKIIGTGVLLFAGFIGALCCYALIYKHVTFSFSSAGNTIVSLLSGCAVLSIPFSMSVYLSWSFATMNKELKKNLTQVQVLSQRAIEQEQEKKRILEGQKEQLETEVASRTREVVQQKEQIEQQHEQLKAEKQKSDDLLLNILPSEVAEELKHKGHSDARFFDDVTVLFTDFVDFTKAGEVMSAAELVSELNICFRAFDEIISVHGIEKIKTIGDAYLAVCGLPVETQDHATRVVTAALEIADFMKQRRAQLGNKTFEVRVGVHSGSVVAGIVGVKKFAYDIWGDTVNTAARIEQNSLPGKVNISQSTFELVKDGFECNYRGEVAAKNKGELKMYFVERIRSAQTVSGSVI